ncbi:MAG: hypothetical protein HON47_03405 [Candidatus Diapherotrites archaeon]|jgi:glutamyl-tRNA synthetase|uniref:Glutamyl/glutaminyl-tRNA synthetase class Ib catalytic domain-containing protein n=1 Tax=Candidatus Iainarchaeum sp. TaxID=3101447 RepID=A0A8T5GEN6_9ARCH|nr:hypothetical protein [Candidatus Diapherotrites archaeon]MBT7241327.1 hypothetical protein [Candidatus Diapherotrites archaeon]
MEVEDVARKYATKNAFEHKGSAQAGAVIGKVKALFPQVNLAEVAPLINKIVQEVNALDSVKLKEEYEFYDKEGWELKQVEKEKTLPPLEWLKKGEKLITRAAPTPSGVMHFGHARPYVLTDEYVKKYGGTYIMRFDDTDAKIKVSEVGMEEEFLKDFKWLGININGGIVRQSDNLKRYYQIMEKLIKMDKAYVCFCESEAWRELSWKSKACSCRKKSVKETMKAYKDMLKGKVKEGEAIVRIKTDLKHKDSSVRDFWIAKIVDDPTKHPNKKVHKLKVFPAYNLASAVDDHDMKINFMVRGQEHRANEDKQRFICEYMGWTHPHTMYHGKISKLGDMVLSKSKMKIIMEKEGILSYDDPRMATMKAFKRRGIRPETVRKLIFESGIGMSEVKIDMKMIAAFNKEFVGPVKEYPFFQEAVGVEIYNFIPGNVKNYGENVIFDAPIETVLVDKYELTKFKADDIVRFKNGFNVKFTQVSEYGAKAQFISYEKREAQTLSWIKGTSNVEILMSDGTKKVGVSSTLINEEKKMVRFEGLGYATNDNANGKFVFSYE